MQADVEIRSRAVIDPLTGMLNRGALRARVDELTQQSRVSGDPVGLIVADIDHFKRVNDLHGHAAGDAVLRDLAHRLRRELHAFDLAGDLLAGHWELPPGPATALAGEAPS